MGMLQPSGKRRTILIHPLVSRQTRIGRDSWTHQLLSPCPKGLSRYFVEFVDVLNEDGDVVLHPSTKKPVTKQQVKICGSASVMEELFDHSDLSCFLVAFNRIYT